MLHAIRLKLKASAEEQYADAVMLWAALAPHQKKASDPPPLPDLLKD